MRSAKKLVCLTLCLLVLCTATALAKTEKHLSTDSILVMQSAEITIPGTGKVMSINLYRTGMFKSLFGLIRTDTLHSISFFVYDDYTKPAKYADDFAFSTKTMPQFSDGYPRDQYQPKATSISAENITYEPTNYELKEMIKNKKLSIVLTTKNGIMQTIEFPKATIDEWAEILNMDLYAEYKKGI